MRNKSNKPKNKRDTRYIYEASDSSFLSDYSRKIKSLVDDCPRAFVEVMNVSLEHVLDTGTNVNIITRRSFDLINPSPKLTKYRRHLFPYESEVEIPVLGRFSAISTANNKSVSTSFIVLKNKEYHSENLLSFKTCLDLGLITMSKEVRFKRDCAKYMQSTKPKRNKPETINAPVEQCESKSNTQTKPLEVNSRFQAKSSVRTLQTEPSTSHLKSYAQTQTRIYPEATTNSKYSKMATFDHLKASIKREYPSLFENRIGKMPGEPAHLETDPKVIPIQRKHFPVPYCLIPSTQKKLTYLIMNDIIEPVPEGVKVTHISPMHPVEKANYDPNHYKNRECEEHQRKRCRKCATEQDMEEIDIRITSDNSNNLNKAIIKQTRPMPSVSTLKYDLNGARFFSKVDIRDAFLTVELDEESKNLTIFSTPWGLYRYKRLNMGLCVASELFQEKMTRNLQGLINVKVAMDDILIFGRTQLEHDEALVALLRRLVDLNLTVGEDKCEFNKEEITFYGMVISKHGIKPKKQKLDDFMNASIPSSIKEVKSFLSLAQYFQERIPNLANISAPLRLMLTKFHEYSWNASHQAAFEKIKTAILLNCLGHFDDRRRTEVWVDAGPNGVAAYIIQSDKDGKNRTLITCGSHAFSAAERNYSQVEIEGYACVWACEHFHIYLYGQQFDLYSDNKSMVQILESKSDASKRTPLRLVHWKARLVRYN